MLTTKSAGTGHGGAKLHMVYDGERFVCSIQEVFRDVFYVSGSGARFRSLRAAVDHVETATAQLSK